MRRGFSVLSFCLCMGVLGAGKEKSVSYDFQSVKASAVKGDAGAQCTLGWMYDAGKGVAENDTEAVKWFWMAAQQGHAVGQRNLGAMYMKGGSVPVNYVTAYAWFGIAASNGNESAGGLKGTVTKKMTPGQIAAGEKFSKDIIAKFPKVVRESKSAKKPNRGLHGKVFIGAQGKRLVLRMFTPEEAARAARERKAKDTLGNFRIGLLYYFGDILEQDYKQAVWWFRKAAEQGLAEAQDFLGMMYDDGQGVEKDDKEAVKWWRKAAEQGYASAQFNLGNMYADGTGVPEDGKEAVKWFRKAAEQGYAGAQFNLGYLYAHGEGVLEDDKEAVKWYRKAAEQGDAGAQLNLGYSYAHGEGVLEDDVTAYAWYNIAAFNGNASGKKNKGILAKRMSPNQIAEAQRLSKVLLNRIKGVQEAEKRGELPKARVAAPENRQPTSFGTGFFITDDGYLMTNLHVVNKANSILVKTRFGNLPAKVIKVDANNDLAVLKVAGRFNALPIASSRAVRLGADVFTVGYPRIGVQGLSPKLTKGAINSLAGVRDDPRHFQVSVPIQPGNSGGPLVDENGNVVGVIVSTLNAELILKREGRLPQSVNYAVKGSFANSFLESIPNLAKKLKAPNAAGRAGKFTDLVDRVEAATVLIAVFK